MHFTVHFFVARLLDAGYKLPEKFNSILSGDFKKRVDITVGKLPYGENIEKIRGWMEMVPIVIGLGSNYGFKLDMKKAAEVLKVASMAGYRKPISKPDLAYWLAWKALINAGYSKVLPNSVLRLFNREISQLKDVTSLIVKACGDRTAQILRLLIIN